MMLKVGVVIVTFNRKEFLFKTLESLKNQSRKPDKLIIVDNGSNDGTMDMLLQRKVIETPKELDNKLVYTSNDLHYVNLCENKGGAGGFYFGTKLAVDYACDWVWLMDDDICPRHDTLDEYMNFILNHENLNIGALMGLRYYGNKPFSFETFEHNLSSWKVSLKDKLLDYNTKDYYTKIADYPFEGPIINCNVIEKIGYPNEEFFIIGDDTDYSIRINQSSNSFFLPSAKFDRLINPFSNSPKKFDWKSYYMLRNMIYINRCYAKNRRVKWLRPILMSVLEFKKYILLWIKYKDISYMKNTLKIIEATLDGYLGRLGKKYVPGDF